MVAYLFRPLVMKLFAMVSRPNTSQQKGVESKYRQVSSIRRTLGNKIVDHSDVAGASPVGAAPTTSSFST